MNGVKELYGVKLKQTSKGIWYCDGLTVEHHNDQILLVEIDEIMGNVEEILARHNQIENDEEKEKD